MSKNNSNQLKIGIILNYVNMIIGNLIPVFYTPIMLNILGKGEYGLYKLSSSVTSYLALIAMGIGSAVTRYLIKAKTEEGEKAEGGMFALFLVIFQVIAIVSFVIGVLLALNLQIWYSQSLSATELSRMRVLVFLMVCNTALSFSVSPYISIVTAREEFLFYQIMNIGSTCILPIFNLIALFLGYASIGMAVTSLAVNMLIRIIYIIYVNNTLKIHPRFDHMPINLIFEILKFSFWIFLSNVANQLYNSTDTIMIAAVPTLGTSAVAIYNVGATFSNIIGSLTTGISSLLTPKTNKMVFSGATNAELTDLAIAYGRFQGFIAALVTFGFIAFGKPFIYFYVGNSYVEAYWVAIFMVLPGIIPLIQSLCLSIIVAENKHAFRSAVYCGIAILNVIGTWFLINTNWGIVGAALVTGIALFLGAGCIMNWYYCKKVGLDIIRFWKEILPIFIIPVCMCSFFLFCYSWIDFYRVTTFFVGGLIYSCGCCWGIWHWFLNYNEKVLILDTWKSLTQRLSQRKRK